MEKLDRSCCIMFDEMSIEAELSYNRKLDLIDGFENCGDGRRLKIADHAMVFMARGLRKKWKQPLAYFFADGGMKSADLSRNIR